MLCVPSPNQEQAHKAMLVKLSPMIGGEFLPNGSELSEIQFGNMGEFISSFIGEDAVDYLVECHCDARNAYNPLNPISVSGVDLMWVQFGTLPSEDRLYIQEVKTTSQSNLSIANGLIDDYEKLFGTDQNVSLKSRVSLLKVKVRSEWKRPDLAQRCTKFVGVEPTECDNVTILPTVVFDSDIAEKNVAVGRLTYVQTTLLGRGWTKNQIEVFGISLSSLRETISELAWGK